MTFGQETRLPLSRLHAMQRSLFCNLVTTAAQYKTH